MAASDFCKVIWVEGGERYKFLYHGLESSQKLSKSDFLAFGNFLAFSDFLAFSYLLAITPK